MTTPALPAQYFPRVSKSKSVKVENNDKASELTLS